MVDSLFEGVVDMCCSNLHRQPGGNEVGADGGVMVGCIGHDVGYPSGKCFDWAICCLGAVVTDALSSFPILLVGDA